MTTDWSFARRPIWLAGHVVAVAAVVVFVMASLWQLDRHEQRRALNAEIDARLSEAAVPLASIVDDAPGSIRFRSATATGTFDTSEEVMLVLQSLDGVSGHRVLTPLVGQIGDYDAVVVDRGWVPLDLDEPGDGRFAPPVGEVEVTGFVLVTQTEGRRVPETGSLTQIGRVDLARLQEQIDYRLAPVFLHVAESIDGDGGLPRPVPLPALDAGRPHLSYSVQWAIFALVVVVGYVVLMFRTSRRDVEASAPG